MKAAKRKFYQTLFVLSLIVLQCTMSVHAGGLVQSEESVSVTLYHEHTQADCWDRKWIPCGGWWKSYFEEYVGATVYVCTNQYSTEISNGVVLSTIHSGWNYQEHTGWHDGEYASYRICDQTVAGTFTVTKVISGIGDVGKKSSERPAPAELVASVTSERTGISDVSFCWKCPDQSVIEGERVTISQNGVYCATLNWRDAKTGVDHTTTIDYVEVSNPILLVFRNGSRVLDEIEVSYGDPLPNIEIPVKEGYDFKGYYVGFTEEGEIGEESDEENRDAKAWYDEEGSPDESITLTGSALKETLTAKWEARSYCVYYGEDKDGDGTGDYELHVTYGKEYGPVEIDVEQRNGYIFDGYYLGDEQVFDSDGNATGVWRWDEEDNMILKAVYHKKPDASSGYEDHGDGEKESDDIVPALSGHVSGNSVSGNDISANNISSNGISDDDSSDGQFDSGWERTGGGSDGGGYGESDEEYGDGDRKPFDVRISSKYDSSSFDADADESIVAQETVTHQLSENLATKRTTEAGMLWNSTTAVKAIEVTGITAGTLGLAYLVVWMFITKASLAEIYSVSADGSRRRLGAVLILHGENAFHIHIKERMLEKGETGKYQMVFRKRFAVKYANQDMIIHCREKEISEVIRPEIGFYIE